MTGVITSYSLSTRLSLLRFVIVTVGLTTRNFVVESNVDRVTEMNDYDFDL